VGVPVVSGFPRNFKRPPRRSAATTDDGDSLYPERHSNVKFQGGDRRGRLTGPDLTYLRLCYSRHQLFSDEPDGVLDS